ncbi:MAG: YihY/virulence factor BrkB family protein [Chloroflexota bacterium]
MTENEVRAKSVPAAGLKGKPAWRVMKAIADGLSRHEAPMRSAALAYQGIFSLFPLLLFLVFLGSQVLSGPEVRSALEEFLLEAVPTEGTRDFIEEVVGQTLANRGSIGLIGGLGLLWTASSLINSMEVSLNVIWNVPRRPAWRRRAIALAAIVIVGTLFILSIVLSALPVLPFLDRSNPLWAVLDVGFGVAVEILLFFVIYWGLPNTTVSKMAALTGAVLAGVFWEIAQLGFRFYLTSGLASLGAVYGTLATVVGLILWAFLTGMILYIGAELSASLQREFWPQEER